MQAIYTKLKDFLDTKKDNHITIQFGDVRVTLDVEHNKNVTIWNPNKEPPNYITRFLKHTETSLPSLLGKDKSYLMGEYKFVPLKSLVKWIQDEGANEIKDNNGNIILCPKDIKG